ncbi:RNA-guided endonuclease IscB [Crocosphaera chwakensis]|uniref:HNH endonuclease n=1 Tax=Crocosphaera chwakensis CCY0110 TaxID=391612 RepID=A3IY22_9CHRO|nr:RNA-guided endonuclease IscB [Crocosphaera chwakensis]EAZ88598.1 HNH endonuclease [Crocosphaera chwakensis CCY0110]
MFVFVLSKDKRPLSPCHQARARKLLKQGKAAVYRKYPFTIILKEEVNPNKPKPCRIKLDPGAKVTGIALIQGDRVIFGAELEHRGFRIKDSLESRRQLRRGRRGRKTRYRKPRFLNRTRPKGWLPPSLQSRVENINTWVNRLRKLCPVDSISVELVRFDTQQLENPEISGVEYQQGTLFGYEVREYLLEKYNRTCQYCGAKEVPFEIEHIVPKSKGGSDRVSNLTLSCHKCNQKKGNRSVEEFLKGKPEVLKRVKANAKKPLRDAAAVNAARWAVFNRLKASGLEVEAGSGGLTKFNRTKHELPKTHWLDAACVGKSTPSKLRMLVQKPLKIKATGHGTRQMCRTNKYGFPTRYVPHKKDVKGFQTGDIVKAVVTKGKKTGIYVGRVAVRSTGSFNISTAKGVIQGINHKYCRQIHKKDGYSYAT